MNGSLSDFLNDGSDFNFLLQEDGASAAQPATALPAFNDLGVPQTPPPPSTHTMDINLLTSTPQRNPGPVQPPQTQHAVASPAPAPAPAAPTFQQQQQYTPEQIQMLNWAVQHANVLKHMPFVSWISRIQPTQRVGFTQLLLYYASGDLPSETAGQMMRYLANPQQFEAEMMAASATAAAAAMMPTAESVISIAASMPTAPGCEPKPAAAAGAKKRAGRPTKAQAAYNQAYKDAKSKGCTDEEAHVLAEEASMNVEASSSRSGGGRKRPKPPASASDDGAGKSKKQRKASIAASESSSSAAAAAASSAVETPVSMVSSSTAAAVAPEQTAVSLSDETMLSIMRREQMRQMQLIQLHQHAIHFAASSSIPMLNEQIEALQSRVDSSQQPREQRQQQPKPVDLPRPAFLEELYRSRDSLVRALLSVEASIRSAEPHSNISNAPEDSLAESYARELRQRMQQQQQQHRVRSTAEMAVSAGNVMKPNTILAPNGGAQQLPQQQQTPANVLVTPLRLDLSRYVARRPASAKTPTQ
jgi:hypothetical protein